MHIMDEYNQERYAWYDFEADWDDWYIDSCHFWDDNYFHLLFDESTPPQVDKFLESKHRLFSAYSSSVLLFSSRSECIFCWF
jgi:hypothetical protein